MQGFTYTYKTIQEIVDIISVSNIGVIIGVIFSFLGSVFIITHVLPILGVMKSDYIKKKKAKKRKNLMKQILLQKEIEDEIEEELQTK